MKCLKLMLLAIGAALILSACSKEDIYAPGLDQVDQAETTLKAAKKPAAKLIGIMALDFNEGVFLDPNEPVWEGTIDFGEPYGEYGMRFFNIGGEGNENSKASPFEELFQIYDLSDESILLAGHDEGVSTMANSKYRMNGVVEVANPPFEMWQGRKVHMSGDITWGPDGMPETAPGIFRIN